MDRTGHQGCWQITGTTLRILVILFFTCVVAQQCAAGSFSRSGHRCGHHHHHFGLDIDDYNFHDSDDHHELEHHDHHDQSPAYLKAPSKLEVLPEEMAEEEELAKEEKRAPEFRSGHLGQEGSGYGLPDSGLWLRAMGCSLLVSTASLICLMFLPVISTDGKPSAAVVDVLSGFGAGAMLGDAFLHQLPHAFGGSSHVHEEHVHSPDHSHGHETSSGHGHAHSIQDLSIGLSVLAGILLFFIVEKVVRYVEEKSALAGVASSQGHHHHHKQGAEGKQIQARRQGSNSEGDKDEREPEAEGNPKALADHAAEVQENVNEPKAGAYDDIQQLGTSKQGSASGWVLAYLNLFSDGVHNFTDGMALGSAFLVHGTVGGWSRTLFLLAHEVPQEIGDFGILVRSGLSVTKALTCNFLSALLAMVGTTMALVLGGSLGHSSLIEGFTAGGFIYISVAGVIPGMQEQGISSVRTSFMQLTSMILGVGIAMLISLGE